MKMRLQLVFILLLAALSPVFAADLVTVSGKRFPDAKITASDAGGVDIDYRGADGERFVAYLPFAELPPELAGSYYHTPILVKRFHDDMARRR